MAKKNSKVSKTKNSTETTNQVSEQKGAVKKKQPSMAMHFVAIVLFFVSVLLFIFSLSYLFSWENDQSIAQWSSLFVDGNIEVENSGGKLGAIFGDIFIGKWFGIFGLCIPLILIVASFLLVKIGTHIFRKSFISIVMLMIIGSVSASFLAPSLDGIYGSSLGGGYGYQMSQLLIEMVGQMGAGVVLLMLVTIWLVYTYHNSVGLFVSIIVSVGSAVMEVLKFPFSLFKLVNNKISAMPRREQAVYQQQEDSPFIDEERQYSSEDISADQEPESEEANAEEVYDIIADEIEDIQQHSIVEERESVPLIIKPSSHNDYSAAVDPNDAVFFNAATFDYPIVEDHDDDLFKLREREVVTPVITEIPDYEQFEVIQSPRSRFEEVDFEVEVAEPMPYEAMTDSDDISEEAFEISVTDNAMIHSAKDSDEQVDFTTNAIEMASDIDDTVFDPTLELSSYRLPDIELLENRVKKVTVSEAELLENKKNIVDTLENFGIAIQKIKATIGPTVTLYEVVPARGVRIAKIKNLEDDIALNLKALGIRIIAPIPGKGTIGIEVPNKDKEIVSMYSVIKSAKFQESKFDLPVVLGRTIQNEDFIIDLAKMPHLLVAGATGQGKSVGLNAIITSLLYKKHPAELKFVLIDPKKVEFSLYAHIEKHFLAMLPDSEEAVVTDFQKVIFTLNSLCIEMDQRYDLLKKAKVRNIKEYNERFISRRLNPHKGHRFLPYFVVIIDEFGDLIMTAGREIETPIARIAQLARAVGIHMVIATQRPSVSIITGAIKANFPARIAFRVATMIDSRTILDQPGANQLIGMGDMLISTGSDVTRVQCAFVDTPEVERVVEYIGAQKGYPNVYELPEYVPEASDKGNQNSGEPIKRDGLFEEIARYVVTNQQGSASTIQRNFSIGFNRAGRIMDQLERAGIVSRQDGSKPRQVLINEMSTLEVLLYDMDRKVEL